MMGEQDHGFYSREIVTRPYHRYGTRKKPRERGKTYRYRRRGKEPVRVSRFGVKCAICGVLVVGCVYLKYSDTAFSRQAMAYLNGVITYDMDFSQPFGELKFVEALFPGSEEVFQSNASYTMPVDGEITSSFGREGSTGIKILAEKEGQQVKACEAGKVTRRGTNSIHGNYLRIVHPDGTESAYFGLGDSPYKEGDTVKKGAEIGTLKGRELYLEVTKDGVYQDPSDYLIQQKI